jgi:hypothetical protein
VQSDCPIAPCLFPPAPVRRRYPLLNFAVVTAIYIFVSFRLFVLTNDLKIVAIPSTDHTLLWRNFIIMALGGMALYVAGGAVLRPLEMLAPV